MPCNLPMADRPGPRAFGRLVFCSAVTVLVVSLLAGCGKRVGDVTGKVQYQGTPVTSGMVTVIGAGGVPLRGDIAEDGSYTVQKVPVGEATFLVSSPYLEASKNPRPAPPRVNPETGEQIKAESAGAEPAATDFQKKSWRQLPASYSDITKNLLKYPVTAGPNTIDLKLE